jgi:hypothetical protein
VHTDRKRHRRRARPTDGARPAGAGLLDGLLVHAAVRPADLAAADRRGTERLAALRESERRLDAVREAAATYTPPPPPWWSSSSQPTRPRRDPRP